MSGKREEYTTWKEHGMGEAMLASARSKDPSTQVGAYITDDNNLPISVGYNGMPRGLNDDNAPWNSQGEETGDMLAVKNTFVVHAELNAILNALQAGKSLVGTTMYVTLFPCNECAKAIIQAGIKKVVYLRMYSNQTIVEATKRMFNAAGVLYVPYNEDKDFSKEEVQDATHQIQKILKRFS